MTQSARTTLGTGTGVDAGRGRWTAIRDYIALTKPSITRMCLLMTAGGLALAPASTTLGVALAAIIGTALAVGAANALNMWLERTTDPLMARTRERPLAAGRISETGAVVFATIMAIAALTTLFVFTNKVTGLLGAFALIAYVGVYTPLKYKTPAALVIGAVPGAMPPLMGWTAATGQLDPAGLALFAMLLCWQMPHFIAIATFRRHDYAAAGIKTLPVVRGDRVAMWHSLAWAVATLAASLIVCTFDVAGWIYGVTAGVTGVAYVIGALMGFRAAKPARWAYRYFIYSIIYLPLLVAGLVVDVLVLS